MTTTKRRNYSVSEPDYHTKKWFSENLLAIEMKKIKVKINKSVYLGLSILEISKTLMCEFWYDYIKPKYQQNAKLCYMDTDSFIIHVKTEDVYEVIADDVEKRFDTSNYEVDIPLPTGKNKKVVGLMKNELAGKIMTESVALRLKAYSYVMDHVNSNKKAKGTKKCVTKRILKFNDYKDCLLNNKINLKSQQKFKSETHFDDYTNENKTEHNLKWPYIPDPLYSTSIIGGSGSGKTNALLNLINNQPNIDQVYLYAKDPFEAKCQYLINKHEKVELKHYDGLKVFIEYSNDMQDVYKNIEEYNLGKTVVTELFIRGRKLNISIVFITRSYFKVPKEVRLNTTHFFITKILNKRELQQIALNHSSDIDFKDFMKIYKKCTPEKYSFLVNDTTLPSYNLLRFKKNLLE